MRNARANIAVALSMIANTVLVGILPAQAASSPDDGAIVATESHVDSPKVFWKNNGFILKSEIGSRLENLEKTVNWVGKGYGQHHSRQQYQFIMADDPAIAPLKAHGDRWYLAPAVPQGHSPIWAGFGADTNIPTEKFRDTTFTLDMVNFDGPGRMELFNYYEGFLKRILSSHDTSLRAAYLSPGRHTHNETAFTKPGRYVVTYRATARDKVTGKIIASQAIPHVWQVGGTRPETKPSEPLRQRFAAAPLGTPETPYTFAITAHLGREKDGDHQLTDFLFDAHDERVHGRLAILIDGYHLAELPVTKGKALWPEMIGSGTSRYQAIFVPDKSSPGYRWASEQLPYAFGDPDTSTTTNRGSHSIFPARSNDPAPAFSQTEYEPKNYAVTVSSHPLNEETSEVTVVFQDPHLRASVSGGYYRNEHDTSPSCIVEGTPRSDGVLKYTVDRGTCEGYMLRLKIEPHPMVRAQGITVTTTEKFDSSIRQSYSEEIKRWSQDGENNEDSTPTPDASAQTTPHPTQTPGENSPVPSPAPTPTHQPEEQPGTQNKILTVPVVLSKGHVDIQARLNGDRLEAIIHDDTTEHAKGSVDRSVSSVSLAMGDSTLRSRPTKGLLSKSQADFLPSNFYYVDATWDNTHIWPGWSTTGLEASQIKGDVTLTLSPNTTPHAGAYHLFTVDGLHGTVHHLVDSSNNRTKVTVPLGTHAHASWAFNRPGAYLINVSYQAEVNGRQVQSIPQCLTFLVGNQAIQDHAEGKTPSCRADGGEKPHTTPSTPQIPRVIDIPPQVSSGIEDTQPGVDSDVRNGEEHLGQHPNGYPQSSSDKDTVAKKALTQVCNTVTKVGDSHTISANTHVHPNWVFTKEGNYRVKITQTATLKDGRKLSAPMVLNFAVGSPGNTNTGHYDVGASIVEGSLIPAIKDPQEKWHNDVSSFTFGLGESSRATAPEGIDFLAKAGSPIWMISSSQVADVPWLGANTMHPSVVSETSGPVTWTLDSVEGPGVMAVFTSGNLGDVVGEKWFGGAVEKCGYVDENGNPVSSELAHTGVSIGATLCLSVVFLFLGACACQARRRRRG